MGLTEYRRNYYGALKRSFNKVSVSTISYGIFETISNFGLK